MPHCTKCNIEKPIQDFAVKNKKKSKRQAWCRGCQNEYSAKHYKNTKEKYRASRAEHNKKNAAMFTKYVNDHKSENGCFRCGWNEHPVGLDFHHTDDTKEFHVSRMRGMNLEKVKSEMAKCVVVCACCHRIIHS